MRFKLASKNRDKKLHRPAKDYLMGRFTLLSEYRNESLRRTYHGKKTREGAAKKSIQRSF